MEKHKHLLFFCTALAVLLLDLVSKHMALTWLTYGMTVPVLGRFFGLTLTYNTGGSFGIMAAHGNILQGFVIVALLVFVLFFRKIMAQDAIYRFSSALIVGGAAGNLVDRIRLGHVVDFLDFHVWPVFNIADSFICIGVFAMALRLICSKERGTHSCTG